ncbi:MAG: YchJ family protein [Spirochaetaceae bacterium]|jgi:SEC-C motif-containing protein|nr:YchJ family protein [Spirochaetaceae bacterium]
MNKEYPSCPCGSGKTFTECCEPIILGTKIAPTAEALMRARYAAYATEHVDFILTSFEKQEKDNIDPEGTRSWSSGSVWNGLTVIRTEKGGPGDTEGTVEFEADYTRKGLRELHHETARFKKVDGRWVYSDGDVRAMTTHREGRKIGRNEPCPCGSGKKYKQCCGR